MRPEGGISRLFEAGAIAVAPPALGDPHPLAADLDGVEVEPGADLRGQIEQ
jgi:hypothetical protein